MVGKQIHRVFLLVVAGTMVAGAMDYQRERYDVIIERSPFGEDPSLARQQDLDEMKNAKVAADAAKKMEKEMRLCYLLEAETGDIRAGFQNLKAQTGEPKSIMLRVGESFNGMKLSSVNMEENSATLAINGKKVTFELATASAAPAAKVAAPSARRFGGGFRSAPVKEPQPELTAEEKKIKRAALTERLRHAQMEILRKGQPALPIALTQEMDDQLVAEGILPPN
ncbi:MAG: hypothetical protein V5783_12570 [Pontiella sp.]